jgi:disease resistance protein RPM1
MAEAAVVAALKVLGTALAGELVKLALSKFLIFSNLKSSMSRIGRELRVIKAYLDEMEIHDESNNSLVAWTKEVQILANQIEDTVVEFAYIISDKKFGGISFYGKTMLQKPKTVVALKRIAFELSDAEKSVKHLADIKMHWVPPTISRIGKKSDHLYSKEIADDAHFIDEDQIVGIQEDEDMLTNLLNSNNRNLSVITISGMGGVGKTTLVTKVFKREQKF